jgi:hypothetical protein
MEINLGTIVDDINKYEEGEMTDQEVIGFFQGLVDSGIIWQLQGHYGRTAVSLLKEGLIK